MNKPSDETQRIEPVPLPDYTERHEAVMDLMGMRPDDVADDLLRTRAELARTREALRGLLDVQNGPPLRMHASAWQMAVDEAESLLADKPAACPECQGRGTWCEPAPDDQCTHDGYELKGVKFKCCACGGSGELAKDEN